MMAAAGKAIRVAIVEDDRTMRLALRSLIAGTDGFECIGAYSGVEDAMASLTQSPNVILLDIHLTGMPGSEGVHLFRERYPDAQVVMLTVLDDAERVFESICNGACGYLLKKTPPGRLLESIREAHEGGAPMTPEIAGKVIALF